MTFINITFVNKEFLFISNVRKMITCSSRPWELEWSTLSFPDPQSPCLVVWLRRKHVLLGHAQPILGCAWRSLVPCRRHSPCQRGQHLWSNVFEKLQRVSHVITPNKCRTDFQTWPWRFPPPTAFKLQASNPKNNPRGLLGGGVLGRALHPW